MASKRDDWRLPLGLFYGAVLSGLIFGRVGFHFGGLTEQRNSERQWVNWQRTLADCIDRRDRLAVIAREREARAAARLEPLVPRVIVPDGARVRWLKGPGMEAVPLMVDRAGRPQCQPVYLDSESGYWKPWPTPAPRGRR